MQMGFNNDVNYRDLIVHIQTEDHGMSSKKITSQVFFSGAILDSKTISYEDDIKKFSDDNAKIEHVRKLMKALHRQFYKRINSGIYDERLGLEPLTPVVEAPKKSATTGKVVIPSTVDRQDGFAVAGEMEALGDAYHKKSRGMPLPLDAMDEPVRLVGGMTGDYNALGVDESHHCYRGMDDFSFTAYTDAAEAILSALG